MVPDDSGHRRLPIAGVADERSDRAEESFGPACSKFDRPSNLTVARPAAAVSTAQVDGPRHSSELADIARDYVDVASDRLVKRRYMRWFAGGGRVLDVGCGTGVFLDLLREHGFSGVGLDASAHAAAACRERDHEVVQGDAVAGVRRMARRGEAFDGVLIAHVIEHLDPWRAVELLRAIATVLVPGGRLVIVTPNLRNAIVAEETFWLDPTHVRPYPRQLLQKLCAAVDLRVIESFDDPATRPRRIWWRRAVAAVRSALSGTDRSGPMDSIVVAERA